MFPPAQRIATNGIHLAVHEAGEGPTAVVLLHGFPELAYSWRKQIGPLADAGFRVIAPDQRGYPGSDAPADPAAYTIGTLVADVAGVLDALGVDRAVWIGHDFGGMVAWHAGAYAPDRVLGVASLCTPYTAPGRTDLVEAMTRLHGPGHYMAVFQRPGVGEELLGRDTEAMFRAVLRGHGEAPPEVLAVPAGVFVGDPPLPGEPVVTDEELRVYVEAYERSGFTGPLNWYRALHATWGENLGRDLRYDKPALMVSAADDPFLPPRTTRGMDELLPRLERHVIPDAGHWLQQERPEAVNAILLEWLSRHQASQWMTSSGSGRAAGRKSDPIV